MEMYFKMENALSKAGISYAKLGGLSMKESIEIKSLMYLFTYMLTTNKIDILENILTMIDGIGIKSVETYVDNLRMKSVDIKHKFRIPKKIEEVMVRLNSIVDKNDSNMMDKLNSLDKKELNIII